MELTKAERERLGKHYRSLKDLGEPVLFESAASFARWALNNGYEYGMKLARIDPAGPWSYDNCKWVDAPLNPDTLKNQEKRAEEWDAAVAAFRERLEKAREEAARRAAEERKAVTRVRRDCWCYEHPDLVREGIVWTG